MATTHIEKEKKLTDKEIAIGTTLFLVFLYIVSNSNNVEDNQYQSNSNYRSNNITQRDIDQDQKSYKLDDYSRYNRYNKQNFKILDQNFSEDQVIKIIGILSYLTMKPESANTSNIYSKLKSKNTDVEGLLIQFLNIFTLENNNRDWYEGLCKTSQYNLYKAIDLQIEKFDFDSMNNQCPEIIKLRDRLENKIYKS